MIDPSIALSYHPAVQQESPLQTFGQLASLQAMQQQRQLGAAQITALGQENQQRAIALQDQQNMRSAFSEWDGKDPDSLFTIAQKKAVSPQALFALKGTLLDQKVKYATLDETTKKNLLAQNTAIQSALAPVLKEKDPARQKAGWDAASQSLVTDGWISAQQAAQHPYPGSTDAAESYIKGLNLEKWTLSQEQQGKADESRATAALNTAKLPGETVESGQKVKNGIATRLLAAGPDNFSAELMKVAREYPTLTDLPTRYDPKLLARYGMSAEQVSADTRADTVAAESARHDRADEGLGATRNQIAGSELNLKRDEYNATYGANAGSQPLGPAAESIAKLLARGHYDPQALSRMPGREAIQARAIYLNPNWTPQIYDTVKAFTDPDQQQAKNLQTISRIVGHISRFETNSKTMGFAPAYSAGVNKTGGQNKLNEDADAIAGELEKLVSGGVGSEGRIDGWKASLRSPNAGARQEAIDEISHLVGSQYEAMQQAYRAGTQGEDLPMDKLVSPAGRAWMKAKGIDGEPQQQQAAPQGGGAGSPSSPHSPTSSNTGGKPLTDPALAAAYLRIAGGDKAKAREAAKKDGWSF